MTARQPFTTLCKQIAASCRGCHADLHIHTTHSDGAYTPAQVVDLARRSGLQAVAITDHDTTGGITPARNAASTIRPTIEVISGVELTALFHDCVVHILGYFFDAMHVGLCQALDRLREQRHARFREMVTRLEQAGVALDPERVARTDSGGILSRRHLAELLIKEGKVGSIQEAFTRFLGDDGRIVVRAQGLPVAEAIERLRAAGGVAALAHPPYDCTKDRLRELRDLGMEAVEVAHPSLARKRSRELKGWAKELGLAVTGGSDCHGPGHYLRTLGAAGVTGVEMEELRARSENR
jgi:predicted metal-dependent phosphoesterase TrpH